MSRPAGEADQIVTVGRIGAPYAVSGWMRLESFTDPLENILQYDPWKIGRGRDWRDAELAGVERDAKGLRISLKGCASPEEARRYTGMFVGVPVQALPETPDGEYYWHQLHGLQVCNEAGENLGHIEKMLDTGANDVMVVQPDPRSIDDRERLIPWLQERVVRRVDLGQGVVRVDWPADY